MIDSEDSLQSPKPLEIPPVQILSPLAALAGVFYRPQRTFASIAQRPSTWWIPFGFVLIVFYLIFFGTVARTDFQQLRQKALKHPTQQSWQLQNMPAAQLAMAEQGIKRIKQFGWLGGPLLILLYFGMEAAVLLAVLHYGFHAQALLRQVFAVAWYASLPGLILMLPFALKPYLGGTISAFWSLGWLSLGHYLHAGAKVNLLYSIVGGINVFDVWSILLATIGLAVVTGTRRIHALVAALVWWFARWIAWIVLIGIVGIAMVA